MDDGLLERAQRALGTTTMKDTVNGALAAAVADKHNRVRVALEHFAELGREGALTDRDEAW